VFGELVVSERLPAPAIDEARLRPNLVGEERRAFVTFMLAKHAGGVFHPARASFGERKQSKRIFVKSVNAIRL